jgi:adenylate cyclase
MVTQVYDAIGDSEGMQRAARRSLERCQKILRVEPDHGGALGFLVNALADLGEAERAREWAKRAVLFDPDNARLHYNLACAMAKVGADTAFELLEGIQTKVNRGWLGWMDVDNSLDPIREHPRYKAFHAAVEARLSAAS